MKTFVCTIIDRTEKAVLCWKKRKCGNVKYWLPLSEIEILEETKVNNMTGQEWNYINIPDWLYNKTFGEYLSKKNNKITY